MSRALSKQCTVFFRKTWDEAQPGRLCSCSSACTAEPHCCALPPGVQALRSSPPISRYLIKGKNRLHMFQSRNSRVQALRSGPPISRHPIKRKTFSAGFSAVTNLSLGARSLKIRCQDSCYGSKCALPAMREGGTPRHSPRMNRPRSGLFYIATTLFAFCQPTTLPVFFFLFRVYTLFQIRIQDPGFRDRGGYPTIPYILYPDS